MVAPEVFRSENRPQGLDVAGSFLSVTHIRGSSQISFSLLAKNTWTKDRDRFPLDPTCPPLGGPRLAMKRCVIFTLVSAVGVILAKDPKNGKLDLEEDFAVPYMVYLQSSPDPCVGCLIHPEWVLTAAHCPLPIQIRLGVYQPTIRHKKEQIRNYSLTVPYPEFNVHTLENDLMMIKLSTAAALNTHVGTIAIAMEPLAFNDSCFIPTWRWNEYKNHSDPDILSWTNQHSLPSMECQNMLDQRMTVNIMCVGQPLSTVSEIKEVSAAPAICNGRVHGILSWAKGSVTLGREGFFTEVHPYARWIMKIIHTY